MINSIHCKQINRNLRRQIIEILSDKTDRSLKKHINIKLSIQINRLLSRQKNKKINRQITIEQSRQIDILNINLSRQIN